jgi:hypothetical protein
VYKTPVLIPTTVIQLQPSATPTVLPTPSPDARISETGKMFYGSPQISARCHSSTGTWSADPAASVLCLPQATELSAPRNPAALTGIYLDKLPDSVTLPGDYILQVEVTLKSTTGAFGLVFRKQSSGNYYTLLYSPANKNWWVSYYNNATGKTITNSGTSIVGSFQDTFTLDLVLRGGTFFPYLNGINQGNASDPNYTAGSLGFVVTGGSDILLKNVEMFALP